MFRPHVPLLLAALLAPVAAHGQADASLSRFVFPNAKALISIDWARIQESPAGAMIRQKFLNVKSTPMPEFPGMELLNDVDRILISSPGNPSPDDPTEPPFLIAIHGHFNAGKVRQLFARFGAKAQIYNSFQVYRPQGKQANDTAFVLFDAENILFGDTASVFATLDRNQFGAPSLSTVPAPGSMVARAAEMERNYDFWLIMDATEILSNESVVPLLQGADWASEAQGFEAGVSLRSGFAADLTVRFATEGTAKRVTAELTRVIHQAESKGTDEQAREIVKKLRFNVDGSATKISLRLTPEEMEKTAQAFAASHQASWSASAPPVARSTPVPVPARAPSKPAVIRIEGLDDGEHDIPYPAPQN